MYDGAYWDKVWSRPYGRYNRHHQAIWEAVLPFLKGKVLDLGCGPCVIYQGKDIDMLGVDISHKALEEAAKNYPKGKYMQWDITVRLPIPDAVYDTVALFGVLDYYEDWDKILKEARRVKKPDGHIVATLLNGYNGHDWTKYKHLTGNWYLYGEEIN